MNCFYLLSRPVPARPADGVKRHVRPVHVVGVGVPVERHGAAQPLHLDHDVSLLGRVERDAAQVGAAGEQQKRTQIWKGLLVL